MFLIPSFCNFEASSFFSGFMHLDLTSLIQYERNKNLKLQALLASKFKDNSPLSETASVVLLRANCMIKLGKKAERHTSTLLFIRGTAS